MLKLEITINKEKISGIKEFYLKTGRCSNMKKDTSFILHLGVEEEKNLLREIEEMDIALYTKKQEGKEGYLRLDCFESYIQQNQLEQYEKIYRIWKKEHNQASTLLPFQFENNLWQHTYLLAFEEVIKEYVSRGNGNQQNRERNFTILLLHWISTYFKQIFLYTKTLSYFPKVVYTGNLKNQGFYFLYFLALCGCDVLYITPKLTTQVNDIKILKVAYNMELVHSKETDLKIPRFDSKKIEKSKKQDTIISEIPVFNRTVKEPERVLEYEELAAMASSVVMIEVYDSIQNRVCLGSGSGVIIHSSGYILTNFHVVNKGKCYGVKLEEEEQIYYTDELVKYHSDYDLAVLKIDRESKPIQVYQGSKELVRGQKVVAIGSPLGLFNTVSDGIISGFRNFKQVSMIQFTAPISSGSSGGALINMYGKLVGINTAGFDDGQNLNLAVDYKTVVGFARGFLE